MFVTCLQQVLGAERLMDLALRLRPLNARLTCAVFQGSGGLTVVFAFNLSLP